MNILGINAYHGNASAAIVCDGRLVAAVEEERFNRVKYAAGFPAQAIRYCLKKAGLTRAEIDHVAVPRNPYARLGRKIFYALRIEYFPPQPRVGVSRHGHVVDFRARQTRLFQTIADRLRGKSRGILDAVKSLLFDGGDQTAVAHNRRGSVSVVGINPE